MVYEAIALIMMKLAIEFAEVAHESILEFRFEHEHVCCSWGCIQKEGPL